MELDKHQKYAAKLLSRNNGGAVWHRVGEGKTRIAYKWFATIAKRSDNPLFIVVCRRKAFTDWKEEAVKCGLTNWRVVDYEIFLGKLISSIPTVLLVSHGMLAKLGRDIASLGSLVQAVAYDEGFLYRTPGTKHVTEANRISEQVGRAGILSGTIMPNRNLECVFGQFYAINKHEHAGIGRTLTEFRSSFMFKFHINPHRPEQYKFVNAKRAVQRVSDLVAPLASVWMPKSTRQIKHIVRHVDPSAAQRRAMARLRDEYYLQTRKGVLELKNAPTLITKCQQISDGFLQLGKTDDGRKGDTLRYGSEKMAYLIEFISELILCGERVIVWCAFNHTVGLVLQRLQRDLPHVKAYSFTGKQKFDERGWHRDGQVVVATEDSGSSVNAFGQVAHAIYYSMSFKWLSLQQSMGRSDRKDSKHPVAYYYYLYTKGSLDAYVHKTAKESGEKEKDFIDLTALRQWLTTGQ